MVKGILYLFPTPISEDVSVESVLPTVNLDILKSVDYFIVENLRTARRFIAKCRLGINIDDLQFEELSEHTSADKIGGMLLPVAGGRNVILMSEAGVPAVADPGSDLVMAAHLQEIEVVPLVGPSSIIMALMGSGMNGQSFVFHGYLPIKPDDRAKRLQEMIRQAQSRHQSQIFIETPYRNLKMFESLIAQLPAQMNLTVASNISSPNQFIKTRSVQQWREYNKELPINKIPTIFIFG